MRFGMSGWPMSVAAIPVEVGMALAERAGSFPAFVRSTVP
jgi:hypothetical protein